MFKHQQVAAIREMRGKMWSPGRPSTFWREHRVGFWEAIRRGLSTEDAATEVGVSPAVGARWFREAGGMPSLELVPVSGRYLSFVEREEIAILHSQDVGVREIARRLGKRPILVRRDVPGFVGNRLQYAVVREAVHILAEGITTAEDIDTAMKAGPGLRYAFIGPLETADLGGLDIFLAVSRYLFPELNSEPTAPALMAELVERGKLGAKTGVLLPLFR